MADQPGMDRLHDLLPDALEAADSFRQQTADYADAVEDYRQGDLGSDSLQQQIDDIARAWRKADRYKQQLDSAIQDIEIDAATVDILTSKKTLASEEGSIGPAVDGTWVDDPVGDEYQDVFAFARDWLHAVSTVAQYESVPLQDDDLQCVEAVREQQETGYLRLRDWIGVETDLLEDGYDQHRHDG